MSLALALDPRELHAHLVAAARTHRASAGVLAAGLALCAESRAFVALGYATLTDYAVAELRLAPREARDYLGLGRQLGRLPALAAALDRGEIGWTKAREVARVAVRDTEAAWILRANEVNSRTLEAEVSAAAPGDFPRPLGTVRPPDRVRMVFEVDASDADIIRKMLAEKRAQIGATADELSDGAILAAAAADRSAEIAPTIDRPSERHQIVIHLCPGCNEAVCNDHHVSDTVLATASCDAEHVDLTPGPTYGHRTHEPKPSVRRAVLAEAGHRCEVPGCANRLWLDTHHLRHRAHGGGHTRENLCVLCPAHHAMVHDGILAIERLANGRLRVTHRDGRVQTGRLSVWEPRGR